MTFWWIIKLVKLTCPLYDTELGGQNHQLRSLGGTEAQGSSIKVTKIINIIDITNITNIIHIINIIDH